MRRSCAISCFAACFAAISTLPLGAQKTRDLDADLARLVPEDTRILIYVASLRDALDQATVFLEGIDAQLAEEASPASWIGQIVPEPTWIDAQGPLVLAFRATGFQDRPVAIFRPQDETRFAEEARTLPIAAAGAYRALFHPGAAAATAPSIARALPNADIAARVDATAFLEAYGDLFEAQLEAVLGDPGSDPAAGALVDFVVNAFGAIRASSLELDLAVDLSGTEIELRCEYRVRPSSALDVGDRPKARLLDLCGSVQSKDALALFGCFDFGALIDKVLPLYRTLASSIPDGETLVASMEVMRDAYRGFGPESAGGATFDAAGMQMSMVARASDPAGFLERLRSWLRGESSMAGLRIVEAPAEDVSGRRALVHRMEFDAVQAGAELGELQSRMLKAFGFEHWVQYSVAATDRIAFGMGPNAAIARAQVEHALRGGNEIRADIQRLLALAGDDAVFGASLDVRAFLAFVCGIAALIEPPIRLPEVPAGAPVPLLLYWSASGPRHRFGAAVDAKAVADLVRALKR